MGSDSRPLILHVVHSLQGGGTERTLLRLLQAFDRSRFCHRVVTLRSPGVLAADLPEDVSCQPLAARGRCWTTGFRLGRLIRRSRASIVHARNTGCWADATLGALLAPGAKLVLGFHGLETGSTFLPGQRRKAQGALRVGARFTSVSKAGRDQLRQQVRVPTHRITVLPNGVEVRRFHAVAGTRREQVRAALGFCPEDFVVGTVGSLTPVKRTELLIRAAAQAGASIPHLRLLIVGDGPLDDALREQARKAGLYEITRFTRWREDIPALLSVMDAYVCCSDSEGMSNALLEAMAAGRAIVASHVGDHARLLSGAVGSCLFQPGDWRALAHWLVLLVNDPSRRKRQGEAARQRAQRFCFSRSVKQYEKYYAALLGPHGMMVQRRDRFPVLVR